MDWLDVLNWKEREVDDLRYVAYCYIRQGCYDTALTFFRALSVLTKPTAYDLQTLGAIYLQMGKGREALEHLDQALVIDPHHLPTQLNRAKALFILGHKGEGLIQAKRIEKEGDKSLGSEASALILANA